MRLGRRHRGFSLIELIVVIGIVMILLGIMLPALGAAKEAAGRTRELSDIRSNLLAIVAYTNDHDGIYPVSSKMVNQSRLDWNLPLVELFYVNNLRETDPYGIDRFGVMRYAMSGALFYPAKMMAPDATVPLKFAETVGIRQSNVSFPAEKGVLVKYIHFVDGQNIFWSYNVYETPASPVVMADGSVITARVVDFKLKYEFFENWVGVPVLSTWDGCKGIDQR